MLFNTDHKLFPEVFSNFKLTQNNCYNVEGGIFAVSNSYQTTRLGE